MFINFWYVAEQSDKIKDQPIKRRMLGQDFVLFRDSQGAAHCLSNTCTHRGGSLGSGKVNGDCIQCPYHGWEFGGDGECRKIPSLGTDAKIPARARVDAYPTVERYGLVFCFLGDLPENERPPIMEIPEWGEEGWTSTIQTYEFDIEYKRSMENGVDPAHNEFVHDTHGFSGQRDDYELPEVKVENTEWGSGFFFQLLAPPLAEKKMQEASGRKENAVITTGTGHHGISSLWTYIHPTDTMLIHQYVYETPIDEGTTSIYLINLRNFLIEPENDHRMVDRNEYVVMQDRDVLMEVHPHLTPKRNNNEYFMPSDACVGRYRERVREWESRGWRINMDEVNRNRKNVAYAIPSPGRRERKGWILDAILLISGDAAEAERRKVSGE